jgi:SAM-dependent methyltransferase
MLKICKKIQFSSDENKMNSIANTKIARDLYYSAKNENVKFLLEKRFSWMNKFINDNDKGIEVGSGAGFTKDFIKNKNFKLTDVGTDDHLDFKNIDAQNTGFNEDSFDYVIASNMIHHIPYPMKFFREINRILKKNGITSKTKFNEFFLNSSLNFCQVFFAWEEKLSIIYWH